MNNGIIHSLSVKKCNITLILFISLSSVHKQTHRDKTGFQTIADKYDTSDMWKVEPMSEEHLNMFRSHGGDSL